MAKSILAFSAHGRVSPACRSSQAQKGAGRNYAAPMMRIESREHEVRFAHPSLPFRNPVIGAAAAAVVVVVVSVTLAARESGVAVKSFSSVMLPRRRRTSLDKRERPACLLLVPRLRGIRHTPEMCCSIAERDMDNTTASTLALLTVGFCETMWRCLPSSKPVCETVA